ncbi:MAG TPA: hypothetical protein VNM43_11570 [Dehalococcoidia bacterium]|nr:hypothetical protein [Dehalococcoidia bacterium]
MPTVRLRAAESRLLYLAVQYHLDRPGAELDPATGRPATHGLGELAPRLLGAGEGDLLLTLTPLQARRLDSAILGAINELKVYPMLAAREGEASARRSMASRFEAALLELWPAVANDPEEALALVPPLVALRRRLAGAAAEAGPSEGERRPWWRFWAR